MWAPIRSTDLRDGCAGLQQRASGRDYDRVFERLQQKKGHFALDRCDDDDIGALTGCIAYVSRKDAARHLQILGRSLRRSCLRRPILLDAGCGTGGYLRWLARRLPAFAVGFDASSVAIAATAGTAGDGDTVSVLVGDVHAVPLGGCLVGAAVALDLLHLTSSRGVALASLRDALAPGATLLFTVLHSESEAEKELAGWRADLKTAGYTVAAVRNLSASWREHMMAKHRRRWERRQCLRDRLGRWVEPELQVSAAMLGLHGGEAVALATERYEFEVIRSRP